MKINYSKFHDPVNHPHHYMAASVIVQPIELTARLDSCLGQALQYVLRAPFKGNEQEDLSKAVFYLRKRADLLKKTSTVLPVMFFDETAGFISAFRDGLPESLAKTVMRVLFLLSDEGYRSEVEQAEAAIVKIQARLDEMAALKAQSLK